MGIRTRRAHRHAHTHAVAFSFIGVIGFVVLASIALAFSLGSLVDSWLSDLPDYTSADAYLVAEPTQVYDANNNVIAEFYLQNRRSTTIDKVSSYVLKGTVDTEDVRFYEHNGVDVQGIARAVYVQITGGSEGASTITQQLVRNTVLSSEQFDYTLKRKVREAYIAIQIEKTYTKDQILMMYLNTIYYGHGCYGIETAAQTYFGKSAADLTLAEAATLAGLPQSPSYYDPTLNPDACKTRRNTVLDRMLSAGDITQAEHDAAQAEPLVLNLTDTTTSSAGTYPYWTNYIKGLLEEDFDSDTILKGGLQVYTTIDPTAQAAAEASVNTLIANSNNSQLDAAFVAIDPSTGYIKAMVGGRDYNTDQFNLATQARRQPGSSFKAFTLTAAVNLGMNPTVILNCNSPLKVTSTWTVQNYDNSQYGIITLARAMELSSNTGLAQVAQTIGGDAIVSMAKAMGISVDLPAYPSLTLGVVGVPPIQMAEAYATLASGGIHRDAVAITKILDRNGRTVYEHKDNPVRVISTSVAYAVTQVLEGVVTSGTASTPNYPLTIDQPVAGKTGTTEEYRDNWYCSYTTQYATAVWVGYREEATVYINGTLAHPYITTVPIANMFYDKVLSGVARVEFETAAAPAYKDNSYWTFSNTNASYNNGQTVAATTQAQAQTTAATTAAATTVATTTAAPAATTTTPPAATTVAATTVAATTTAAATTAG